MGRNILIVAPHPDDETLGCGGTLLRHASQGDHIHWLIATRMSMTAGYVDEQIRSREREIEEVSSRYGFTTVHRLPFTAARMDEVPKQELILAMAGVIDRVEPDWVYLPHPADAHSDHRICFESVSACLKWFRRPCIRRVMCYEVPSETRFGLDPTWQQFQPNVYIAMDEWLSDKLEILSIYHSETGRYPFPRSAEAVSALAQMRGSECGVKAAEAFQLLREYL